MEKLLKKGAFGVSYDQDFRRVMEACRDTPRRGEVGSWIGPEMLEGYLALHNLGYAHSVEVWEDGALVGGLYGVSIGKIFFGESMFSRVSNASKYGFITLVRDLIPEGMPSSILRFTPIICPLWELKTSPGGNTLKSSLRPEEKSDYTVTGEKSWTEKRFRRFLDQ
jgi:hypothetical protein